MFVHLLLIFIYITNFSRLVLNISGRHVTASINHFENGEVLRASTSEWCVKKHLYRTKDTSAFINLGRVKIPQYFNFWY